MKLNLKQQQWLLNIANYDPGSCLCGRDESCEVCSRSDQTRAFERQSKELALGLLRDSGVKVRRRAPKYLMDRERYEIVS